MSEKKLKLTFITGNKNKFLEVKKFFSDNNLPILLENQNIETEELQSDSLRKVAEFKINSIKNKIAGNFFVEDAGFFVDEPLNGFPGVYSSYIMKVLGNEGILKLLGNSEIRRARFQAVIALYLEEDENQEKLYFFDGEVKGTVAKSIRGKNGFGFDPIFIPDEIPKKTFGEMLPEEKNRISHRSRAIKKLVEFLSKKISLK